MRLDEYISEAVSHGRSIPNQFPRVPDKDLIIEWLEYNGFTEVNTGHNALYTQQQFMKYHKKGIDRIYITGLYDESDATHWIRFGDMDTAFSIRTDGGFSFKDPMEKTVFLGPRRNYYRNHDTIEDFAIDVEKTFSK